VAAGAIIAVAVGVSLGASALKTKLASSLREKEEVPPPRQTTDPLPPSTALPGSMLADAPPADDGPPPAPGTPQSSLRARPPWGRLELMTRGVATQQYAPQHTKPLDLFLKASPMNGDIERGFVVCRAQSFNKADTFAGDDLHVRATFANAPEVAMDGPEDGNLGFVSAPLVSLKKNDIIHVAVFDRDVFDLTNLARVNVTYQGTPIVLTDPGAAIECRSLIGDALQSRVATDAGGADQAIANLARAKLHGRTSDWGYPSLDMATARRATGDVAALVGWDDARTKKRVDGVATAIASVQAQRPRVFDELRDGASSETTVDGIKVSFVSLQCGPKVGLAGRCALSVSVTNDSGRAIRWNGHKGPSAYVATRESGPEGVAPAQANLGLKDIAAGATVDVTLHTPDDRPGKEDAIAGICVERRCGAIKLR
jgi:hypothetical protein